MRPPSNRPPTFWGTTVRRRFKRLGGRGNRNSGGRGRPMNRWKLGLAGLTLAVSGLIGCKHQLYIHEQDDIHYKNMGLGLNAPPNLENDPTASINPRHFDIPEPPTVDKSDRPAQMI